MLDNANQIIEARRFLEGKYSARDNAFRNLRKFYNADYWSESEVQGIKLVYNLLASITDRYTDFMSQPPDWQVIPSDINKEAYAQADRQEKILYSQWEQNNHLVIQSWQANYQSMLGMFGFFVLPNMNDKEKYVRINCVIPDHVLPMPRTDNIHDLEFVLVKGNDYLANRELFEPSQSKSTQKDNVNNVYYFDEQKIICLEDGKEKFRITHNFGFIPVVLGQNHPKPHHIEGIGDLDQAIGMNQYLNELISFEADILEQVSNPKTIITGVNSDLNLPTGTGAKWILPEGADVKYLTYPGSPPSVEQMFQRVTKAIQEMTNTTGPMFQDVPSGTTGAAVQSFLSGMQAAMLRKQVAMGASYIRVNEMIFRIIERMFADKEIVVRGSKKVNIFVEKFKGREINGNYRNRAIWPAGVLDQGSRTNIEINKLNNRVQSRRTTMENIGIQSVEDEIKRIEAEDLYEIERQARLENPSGLPPKQAAEMETAAASLDRLAGPGGEKSSVQELSEVIAGIPKIKGAVFMAGQEGDKFILALTDMSDKATIVNKMPAQFKGKLTFRKYDADKDQELQPIVDNEAEAAA